MKKIILGLSVVFASLISAQYYPGGGYGNNYPQYGSYENNNFYFPDDYYYEYPEDYYEDDYYNSFYNDYNQSIKMVNWNSFFREFGLSRNQMNLIINLNRQFPSYSVWSSYYRMNPSRWWYDRFYALERILGPQIFIVFQNRYYNGYSPVNYYNNYWYDYYRPTYYVRPVYTHININLFKVNRHDYHRSVGNNFGFRQERSQTYSSPFAQQYGNSGFRGGDNSSSLRNQSSVNSNRGFRTDNAYNSTGLRPGTRGTIESTPRSRPSSETGMRPGSRPETVYSTPRTASPRSTGTRGGSNPQTVYSSPRSSSPQSIGIRGGNNGGGFRSESANRSSSPRMESSSGGSGRGNSGNTGNRGFR